MAQSLVRLPPPTTLAGPSLSDLAEDDGPDGTIAPPAGLQTPARGGDFDAGAIDDAAPTSYLAAWCTLLFRYAEQERFAVEVLRPEQVHWVGRTAEIAIAADDQASEVLARVAGLLADAPAEYPVFAHPRQSVGFSDLTGAPVETIPENARCRDLHLVLVGPSHRRRCRILYDDKRFTARTVERMAAQYRALLFAFSVFPSTTVRNLRLMDDLEERRLLDSWSGPKLAEPPPLVFQEFERRARETPGARAITLNTQSLTYGELNCAANRVAHWLRGQGVGAGATVGLCMEPCIEFVACMLGAFKAGATHLPLDPGYPPDRLAVILEDTNPAVVLTQRAVAPKLESLVDRLFRVEDLVDEWNTFPGVDPGVAVSPDQIAYIVYTSGTTGKPKGVLVTHANLAHYVAVGRRVYGYGPHDVIPALARYTFSITFFELLCPLTSGARLLLLERGHVIDMRRMVQTLGEVTCIHASPSLWRKVIAFIDEQKLGGQMFHNVRHASSGGDMVPPDILESLKRVFTQAEVFVIYGCSEMSCMGCSYPVPRERTLTSTRVGVPFPNMTLRILDPEGKLVPPGIVGEVCFGGAGLASGYQHAPELTAKKFTLLHGERVYHTGDLGRVDAEGNLELMGRSDFQIKLRGIRIEPGDIEAALREMAGVKDAVVAAPLLSDGDRRLVAYIVPDSSAPPTARALRERLKAKLPDYMVPAGYVLLDALPVNFNNKVDRLALNKAPAVALPAAATPDPPRTETERRLLQLWQKVLDVKDIGVHDEFFDVGGDSLRSVALMSAVDKEMGIALQVSLLLTHPTIAGLAAVIEGRDGVRSENALVCLRRGDGSRPPIFLVHDGDGETMPYRNLALRMHPGHSVYGIQPKSDANHPILHTRLAEMVDFYVEQIRALQPHGPYFVGGLCIGGFLSFEVGRKLRAQGAMVGPIALIDVAHVRTPPRSVAARRMGSLSSAFRQVHTASLAERAIGLARVAGRRAFNMVEYEARARFERRKTQVKLRMFRYCLDNGMPFPRFLNKISVDATLRFAEKEYVVPAPYPGEVILFRATSRDASLDGVVNDTPYIEIFEDPQLGWAGKASTMSTYDIPAGHSSMLREPNVKLLAAVLQGQIDRSLASASPNLRS